MEKFVFENDIVVPKLSLVRCRYEITLEKLRELLDGLPPEQNTMNVTAEDLRDYLNNTGEFATAVKLQGTASAVNKLLDTLAQSAWLSDLPWKVDQVEGFGIGDEKFHKCVRAYIMPDDDHPLGAGTFTPCV